MIKNQLSKRWTRWKTRLVPLAIGAGMLFSGLFPATAHALFVDGPGRVLMVDGTDTGNTVQTLDFDLTSPIKKYDFGFVGTNGSFTSIVSGNNTFGSYTFTGGTLVNFALRDTKSGKIYSITDPKDYADQIYVAPISPSNSRNPVVSSNYYSALVLEWDLSGNGIHPDTSSLSSMALPAGMTMTSTFLSELQMGTTDVGFAVITASKTNDGFAPVGPAPVPLPASFLLFGSGLLGLSMSWKRVMGMVGSE